MPEFAIRNKNVRKNAGHIPNFKLLQVPTFYLLQKWTEKFMQRLPTWGYTPRPLQMVVEEMAVSTILILIICTATHKLWLHSAANQNWCLSWASLPLWETDVIVWRSVAIRGWKDKRVAPPSPASEEERHFLLWSCQKYCGKNRKGFHCFLKFSNVSTRQRTTSCFSPASSHQGSSSFCLHL